MRKIIVEEIRPDGSKRVYSKMPETGKAAQQQFREMTDANSIIKKYKKTGDISLLKRTGRKGIYGDFTVFGGGLVEAHQKIEDARAMFMTLPAELRSKFGNDPHKLLEFVNDVRNYQESVALGLRHPDPALEPKEPPRPDPAGSGGQVPPVTPPPASQPKQ